MITLEQAKEHLRVRHEEHDSLLADHITRSAAMLARFAGAGYVADDPELEAAQLLVIEWLYRPEDEVRVDEVFNLPEAVVAIAGPFRTPTLA